MPADEIRACIKSSDLWAKVEKFNLKTYMRVDHHNDVDSGHYAEKVVWTQMLKVISYFPENLYFSRELCGYHHPNKVEEQIKSRIK